MLGLQCGGSDGYSGITANPALGAVDAWCATAAPRFCRKRRDLWRRALLTRRAVSKDVADKLIGIWRWEEYTARNKGEMNNNPSPGNKAGG